MKPKCRMSSVAHHQTTSPATRNPYPIPHPPNAIKPPSPVSHPPHPIPSLGCPAPQLHLYRRSFNPSTHPPTSPGS